MSACLSGNQPAAVNYEIHHGDGVDGLRAMQVGSVALIVNDPPWGATRARWDRPLDWSAWWAAIDHALAPAGTLVVFASMPLAASLLPIARRPFRHDLVWRKNRASGHLNARRAPLRQHELLLVFGRASYQPQITSGHQPMNAATRVSKSTLYGAERVTSSKAGTTDRYQTSVLSFACVHNDRSGVRRHPTQKPIPLLRWIVRAYSQPDDLVADPTCGSGAVCHAARAEGRRTIGWEIDEAAARSAREWLSGPGGVR